MKLTVINGTTFDIEEKVNEFLSNLPTKDVYKVETVSVYGSTNYVAVMIWTKA